MSELSLTPSTLFVFNSVTFRFKVDPWFRKVFLLNAYFCLKFRIYFLLSSETLDFQSSISQSPHGCYEQSDTPGRSWQCAHDVLIWHLSTRAKLDLLHSTFFFFLILPLSSEFHLEYCRLTSFQKYFKANFEAMLLLICQEFIFSFLVCKVSCCSLLSVSQIHFEWIPEF